MQQAPHIPQWSLGERLRKAREDIGVTQSELAEMIGVSEGTIANYEGGKVERLKPIVVREWARVTGVPDWWLWGSDAPGRSPQKFGWTYVSTVRIAADRGRESGWIYVSPDQLSLDDALGLAA